jgi:hypothetical protein
VLALRFSNDPWGAIWPRDRPAAARALAVTAAYPKLVGRLLLQIDGDVEEALAGLLGDLSAHGLSELNLPGVQLISDADITGATPVSLLPATLSASCEYERRHWLPVFPEDDTLHRNVWTAAASILAQDEVAMVTILAETLDGSDLIIEPDRVCVVSGGPALRRSACRLGLTAVPRPPSSRHLPAADVVVADARRPDDLALVEGADARILVVNTAGISRMALGAFGVVDADVFDARPAAGAATR